MGHRKSDPPNYLKSINRINYMRKRKAEVISTRYAHKPYSPKVDKNKPLYGTRRCIMCRKKIQEGQNVFVYNYTVPDKDIVFGDAFFHANCIYKIRHLLRLDEEAKKRKKEGAACSR